MQLTTQQERFLGWMDYENQLRILRLAVRAERIRAEGEVAYYVDDLGKIMVKSENDLTPTERASSLEYSAYQADKYELVVEKIVAKLKDHRMEAVFKELTCSEQFCFVFHEVIYPW